MNKFSKTSYPHHANFNRSLLSSHQNKNRNNHNPNPDQSGRSKLDAHNQTLYSNMEPKIQIDPILLFHNKTQSKMGKISTKNEKNTLYQKKELLSTSNDVFIKVNKERPESKHESRLKSSQSFTLNNQKDEILRRPQTSKGLRNIGYRREGRNKSLADESNHQMEAKRQSKTSMGARMRQTKKQIELQTSIDPEFLALFAS